MTKNAMTSIIYFDAMDENMKHATMNIEQRKEPAAQRNPPSRFAKFMILTSTLVALGGNPVGAEAGSNTSVHMLPVIIGAGEKAQEKSTGNGSAGEQAQRDADRELYKDSFVSFAIVGALAAILMTIRLQRGKNCGPWGMNLKEWERKLEERGIKKDAKD